MRIINLATESMRAFKAGWIAARCTTGCRIDNESETITPCFLHEAKIAKLAPLLNDK